MTQDCTNTRPSAAMIAIGDELLNGRTRDANVHYLGGWLEARGVDLIEVRFVPDDQARIVEAVMALRDRADMVFTSGGIGPTHDDITADAIGAAFGVETTERADALAVLAEWYKAKGEEVNDRRRRMARVPDGATLVKNTVSGAPGFSIGNVHVLAGVPTIFQDMLTALDEVIARGPVYSVYTVVGEGQESLIADGLLSLESALHGVKIGSYPGTTGKGGPLAIVCKSFDDELARRAAEAVEGLFRASGVEPRTEEGFGPVRD
ncbi:MAG: molybdopterin-binding protein [Pseudomonadota bacterium]